MFQESELISLALGILSLVATAYLRRSAMLPRLPLLYAGMCLVVSGHLFTVIEEVALNDVCNVLEHLSYAAAGCLIALQCRRLSRESSGGDQSREEGE